MLTTIKILLSLIIILTATTLARRFPAAAGLIGVMPLTGLLVLVWVYIENRGDSQIMQSFTRGAFWGIFPTLLFFLVALLCFRKGLPLGVVLTASSLTWIAGAILHQMLLK